MKAIKSILTISALILSAGCASVTDANLESSQPESLEKVTVTQSSDTWNDRAGDDMDPIIDKPDTSE